ncbi:hypothetical protein HDK90DRAFT_89887 [Phyllosticta capitalensis]|uniref:MutL C-terminal dimerisation domain-containing protein n=1 Tax=Phyllosticta capitalensis TaxID=121624 RepID=A0ABR1YBY8_9PEZI
MNLRPEQHVRAHQRSQRPIEPLPPDVVAQIKSSTTITNLAQVVLGLVQNSLDAGATKIEVTIDARRGGCTVEDDGSGIVPSEFALDGGLGKAYYTSRHDCSFPAYGQHGRFLASAGALSLLAITSRHCLHKSYNSITLHRSQVISRQIPAPLQHGLGFGDHGTRVTIRDLFGNMPVRVKQRAMLVEDRVENERQWEVLKKCITSLLLSWQQPVTVRIRDVESKSLLINANRQMPVSLNNVLAGGPKVQAQLRPLLSVLSQTSYITPDEWSSWVPASAATKSISVKGAISLEPAPSKSVQFISLGIHPIHSEDGQNELFDEINRLFNNSSFGVTDDEPELDEREKERRLNDKRYKKDGPTRRQLQGGKKGINRWPMFCLRINLSEKAREDVLESEAKLQSILDVLRAMITEWLSTHHFRPKRRKPRQTESKPTSASSSATHSPAPKEDAQDQSDGVLQSGDEFSRMPSRPSSRLLERVDRKRKRPQSSEPLPEDTSHFTDLSKIRSAKPSFYNTLWKSERGSSRSGSLDKTFASGPEQNRNGTSTFFDTDFVLPGALGPRPSSAVQKCQDTDGAGDVANTSTDTLQNGEKDGTTTWMDPASKETYTVNSRTGTVMQQPDRPRTTSERMPASISTSFHKQLRLDSKANRKPHSAPSTTNTGGDNASQTPWLTTFLSNYSNPVFRPQPSTSESIPRAIFSSPNLSAESANLLHGGFGEHCSHEAIKAAFKEASVGENKLSKTALKSARVISQVDCKFILVIMDSSAPPGSSNGKTEHQTPRKPLVVLIDQHAASERVHLESLLAQLCDPSSTSPPPLPSPLFFELQHPREATLLESLAPRFADWGVVYEVGKGGKKGRDILRVDALPPGIRERCVERPELLLEVLRGEVWRVADGGGRVRSRREESCGIRHGHQHDDSPHDADADPNSEPPTNLTAPTPPQDHSAASPPQQQPPRWLTRTSTCPPGILSLLNSRACRSAIMFNDVLSRAECETLVRSLAGCVFPFQCAHGRPSMVPLVEMDGRGEGQLGLGLGMSMREEGRGRGKEMGGGGSDDGGFVGAFRRWRKTEMAKEDE